MAPGHELGVDYVFDKASEVDDVDLFGVDVEQANRVNEVCYPK